MNQKGTIRLGIDIGGTFTDFIAVEPGNGTVFVGKTLTTPADPAVGVVEGLKRFLDQHRLSAEAISTVIHATTLITNALIERRGARVGLITTSGFADLLEIGREVRYDLYDLFLKMPVPLVPEERRLEVSERIDSAGEVIDPLDTAAVHAVAQKLARTGVEAVAICFLHAYLNDSHERQVAELVGTAFPELEISCSSGVAPEIREFERLSTTVANAYVQPLAGRYLRQMDSALKGSDVNAPLFIMLSNGGITNARDAAETPIRLIESGPAAGALIAGHVGLASGVGRVLAFDMGGTTAKLCLVENGQPSITHRLEVARVQRFKRGSGLPILAPSVELIEIGAGGGSIAHIDQLGLLTVGPQSASSNPGPACYGLGGSQPTVTDADLLLGYLNPEYFLGGAMQLDREAAKRAIEHQLGVELGLSELEIARGIHDIVNENMATAAGVYIAEQGRDPRRYTLIATGGAGPVHAVGVARKLGIRSVLIPPSAGVASAGGLLIAPPRVDLSVSQPVKLDALERSLLNSLFEGLESQARSQITASGVDTSSIMIERAADMRYVNQGHEITVELPVGFDGVDYAATIRQAFDDAYLNVFGRIIEGVAVEIITWRVTARAGGQRLSLNTPGSSSGQPPTQRTVSFTGGSLETPVYRRSDLAPGFEQQGPAIIEEPESTTVVDPRDSFKIDKAGNIRISVGSEQPGTGGEQT